MGKILFLHGFTMNGSVCKIKASSIAASLEARGHLFYFPDGPIRLAADDASHDFGLRSWWVDGDTIELAVQELRRVVREQGPFDGIAGFSQGAAVAQLLSNHGELLGNGAFKFAIYFAGYVVKNQELNETYLQNKIQIPNLSVVGSLDTVIASLRSREFVERYVEPASATFIEHDGAHNIPRNKSTVGKIVEWIDTILPVSGT